MSTQRNKLEYWRALELFCPQDIPKVNPRHKTYPVFEVKPGEALPWEAGHPVQTRPLKPHFKRKYDVYCSVFDLADFRALMQDLVGRDEEVFDERLDDQSATAVFTVTHEGEPLLHSWIVSTLVWAVRQSQDPGPADPSWLRADFEDWYAAMRRDFILSFTDDEMEVGEDEQEFLARARAAAPLNRDKLMRMAAYAALDALSSQTRIRVGVRTVHESKARESDNVDFLNSFYHRDLAIIAHSVTREDGGSVPLDDYLANDGEIDASQRVDVTRDMASALEILAPKYFPPGRWPAAGHHPLVFSQQMAVNAIMAKLAPASGLFSVNGPPGTGKTTLLRDLVAGVVVARALELSKLTHPHEAYDGELKWSRDNLTVRMGRWRRELQGHGIVVTSSNNGAVENISLDIPGEDTIDEAFREEADYFSDFATHLLDGTPAWGLVAARLGRMANRKHFLNRFWFEDQQVRGEESATPPERGFDKTLKYVAEQSFDEWPKAVERFKAAYERERAMMRERQAVHKAVTRAKRDSDKVASQEKTYARTQRVAQKAQGEKDKAGQRLNAVQQRLEDVRAERDEHKQIKPGVLETLLTLGQSIKQWRQTYDGLAQRVDSARQGVEEEQQRLSQKAYESKEANRALRASEAKLEQLRQARARNLRQIEKAREHWGEHVPDPARWSDPAFEAERELSAPWSDPQWRRARAEVFIRALQLHKAFIKDNADTMRGNLRGAMEVIKGGVPASVGQEAIVNAWESLFFLIPVVSTTFASIPRLFNNVGPEGLGWVLIDEAGQANTHHAAVALWRARRAVLVGDPMQLEPIFKLPKTLQRAIGNRFGVEDTWEPIRYSAQEIADRVNAFGAAIHSRARDEEVWVGSPLRVHRRCQRQMFNISNQVAYDGLMVFAGPGEDSRAWPASRWIDVRGRNADGHWIEEEGKALEKLIAELQRARVEMRDIFLISPFRDVVARLRHLYSRWPIRTGTIHTTQGKEADVVVLVLGGNPDKPGSKDWAASKPNLVNVAASRAKHRLYVIGNHRQWSQKPFFDVCTRHLRAG